MKVIVNPKYDYLTEYLKQIPKEFKNQPGEILYEARNLLKTVEVKDIKTVIKSFKQPKFLNRIVYTFLRKSKALRSYQYSTYLLQNDIAVPEPIACIIEHKNGLISNSYYINRYEDAETVRDLMGGNVQGNENILNAFVRFIMHVHQCGILHLDLSPGNILYKKNESQHHFYLIDVNRMKLHAHINLMRASYNLRRLCTSREISGYIARRYAEYNGWDVKKMTKTVQYDSDRFFRKFFFHRAVTRSKNRNICLLILKFRLLRFYRLHALKSKGKRTDRVYYMEHHIYQKYLIEYDFRNLYYNDYIQKE